MSYFEQSIRPMEPRLSTSLPVGEQYRYQVKWDGMRLLAFGCKGKLRLQGKSLREKTFKYPELSGLPQLLNKEDFILDGELIALLEGSPSFFSLMKREHQANNNIKSPSIPVFYMVFDCLYLDGVWLSKHSWESRQDILTRVLQEDRNVHICASFADGENLLAAVKKQKLEGVVAKKRESPYVEGPHKSPYWLKTKVEQHIEAWVGGISMRNGKVASLILGLEENDEQGSGQIKLRHIGNVSSGLTEQDLSEWQKWGRRHEVSHPLFLKTNPVPGREIIWVEPQRRINVTFNEWTPELKLRAPRVRKGKGL